MEDTILFFVICFHVHEQVHSQSSNQSSQGVTSVFEVSLLALTVANVLLCITTTTVVCLLHRHVRKIWIKLSQKDTLLEDHITENGSVASDSWKPEDNSQTLTASSSVEFPAGEKQGSFRLSVISPSSQASTPRLFTRCSPPLCENTMTQKARQSSGPERSSKKHQFTVVDLTLDEDDSGYMDMRSCYLSGPVLSTANESIYDIPRYASVGHLYSMRGTQSQEFLKRPKHSRNHSDPSSYPRSLAKPSLGGEATYAASVPRGVDTEQSSTRSLQAEGPERTFVEETSKREAHDTTSLRATRGAASPKQKSKSSVRGQKQPIDI